MRLRQFAAEHGGALVEGWKLFGAASLFAANDDGMVIQRQPLHRFPSSAA
jgi:hypothetical protein